MNKRCALILPLVSFSLFSTCAATFGDMTPRPSVRISEVGEGWARNSINATIFRTSSIVTHGQTQYISWYNADAEVMLARRQLGTDRWEVHNTGLTGNVRDAHNAIAMGVGADGILHIAWDHHGHELRYVRTVEPGSLEVTGRLEMTGENEHRVTYPEFYPLEDGGLLFMYRIGGSGAGMLMINRYDPRTGRWSPVQHPLIDGEGNYNGYTNQLAVDRDGRWHLSWTWRRTGDVATNHNICYAMSPDQGRSWLKSTGEAYNLPITYDTAEVIVEIPENSELINQCSMTVDPAGRPMIATYWRPLESDAPQYHLVWHDGTQWHVSQVGQRRMAFRLSGVGSRRIPISRPQLTTDAEGRIYMLFRDEERGSRISVATTADPDRRRWTILDLSNDSVGLWEPSYDRILWQRDGIFHIFKQHVGQGQGETLEDLDPTPVSVLEWDLRGEDLD